MAADVVEDARGRGSTAVCSPRPTRRTRSSGSKPGIGAREDRGGERPVLGRRRPLAARCARAPASDRRAAARRSGRAASRARACRRPRCTPRRRRRRSRPVCSRELGDVERGVQRVERRDPTSERRRTRRVRSSRDVSASTMLVAGAPRSRVGSELGHAGTRAVKNVDRRSRPAAAGGGGAAASGSPLDELAAPRYIAVCVSTATTPSSASISRHSSACPKIARPPRGPRTISSAVAPVSSARRNANVVPARLTIPFTSAVVDDLAPQRMLRDPVEVPRRGARRGSTRPVPARSRGRRATRWRGSSSSRSILAYASSTASSGDRQPDAGCPPVERAPLRRGAARPRG